MHPAKWQRLYILLRPCAKGGGGYARLEQARGKYELTLNAHGFAPQEAGIRLMLASRDEGGGAAVCDLGVLPISEKGRASLAREVSATPGGLPMAAYSALCIARDWPKPQLLLMGEMEKDSSLSAYLMEETIRRFLSVPQAQEEPKKAPAQEAPPQVPAEKPAPAPAEKPAPAPILPFAPAGVAALPQAAPIPPAAIEAEKEEADPAVHVAASVSQADVMAQAEAPAAFPVAAAFAGRPPVTALPKLAWPADVKELEGYFSSYPPFAPFDAPGWRFVKVPAAGGTVPYYAVGMLAREGRVVQVAYAVPGERGGYPPAGFSGYRWQQGRNGQGYWTLWKRA